MPKYPNFCLVIGTGLWAIKPFYLVDLVIEGVMSKEAVIELFLSPSMEW